MNYYQYHEFNTLDIYLASFSLFATFLEIRKEISCWYYWIICNFGYMFLYLNESIKGNEMWFYTLNMAVIGVFSVYGLKHWSEQNRNRIIK